MRGYLAMLSVDPAWRQRGIGMFLMFPFLLPPFNPNHHQPKSSSLSPSNAYIMLTTF